MDFHKLKVPKEIKPSFYQEKYDHFRKINLWAVIVCCLGEVAFFFTDSGISNGFSKQTFIPRFIILIPLALYILAWTKIRSYKIMVPLSYLIMHGCMWCSIWAFHYLGVKSHAQEGFIIISMMFLGVGICAPIRMHIIFHSFVVVNIAISFFFNEYQDVEIMLPIALGCVIGILIFLYVFEKLFVEQQKAKHDLEFLSVHDQLTGVFNRTKLKDIINEETNELNFEKCGIILFDIDFFKSINDSYGHDSGDKVLSDLSKLVLSCVRNDDYCIRWGGEEFVVMVPEQSLVLTKEIAERIRSKIENYEDFIKPITISAGVTIYNGGDYHEAIAHADKALYFAKDNGRNMVIAYEDM